VKKRSTDRIHQDGKPAPARYFTAHLPTMLMRIQNTAEKNTQPSATSRLVIFLLLILLFFVKANAQPVMETGGQKMPNEWIDKSTGHKIIRLTRQEGSSMSFYFHNNPFIGNKMIFYNSSLEQPGAVTDMKRETYNLNVKNKQLYIMDLKTLATQQLTPNHRR
jgi:hypothetical protein